MKNHSRLLRPSPSKTKKQIAQIADLQTRIATLENRVKDLENPPRSYYKPNPNGVRFDRLHWDAPEFEQKKYV